VTGKVRLEIQDTDLSQLASEAIENIRPSVTAKQLHLQVRIEPAVRSSRIPIGCDRSCGTF